MRYKIVRCHFNNWDFKPVIKDELTEDQAHEHCNSPETSSRTCKEQANMLYTALNGPWFDTDEEM